MCDALCAPGYCKDGEGSRSFQKVERDYNAVNAFQVIARDSQCGLYFSDLRSSIAWGQVLVKHPSYGLSNSFLSTAAVIVSGMHPQVDKIIAHGV